MPSVKKRMSVHVGNRINGSCQIQISTIHYRVHWACRNTTKNSDAVPTAGQWAEWRSANDVPPVSFTSSNSSGDTNIAHPVSFQENEHGLSPDLSEVLLLKQRIQELEIQLKTEQSSNKTDRIQFPLLHGQEQLSQNLVRQILLTVLQTVNLCFYQIDPSHTCS